MVSASSVSFWILLWLLQTGPCCLWSVCPDLNHWLGVSWCCRGGSSWFSQYLLEPWLACRLKMGFGRLQKAYLFQESSHLCLLWRIASLNQIILRMTRVIFWAIQMPLLWDTPYQQMHKPQSAARVSEYDNMFHYVLPYSSSLYLSLSLNSLQQIWWCLCMFHWRDLLRDCIISGESKYYGQPCFRLL